MRTNWQKTIFIFKPHGGGAAKKPLNARYRLIGFGSAISEAQHQTDGWMERITICPFNFKNNGHYYHMRFKQCNFKHDITAFSIVVVKHLCIFTAH